MAKITNAGLALIAQLQAAGQSLAVDKIIYANIDGIDYTQEPPGTEVKPAAGDIVRESNIAAAGYVDPNTVVYSDVLTSDIGDFSFNWLGLFSTANNTLIAVSYVPLQYKIATEGFNIGNSLCKNFALNYTDIKDLTGITIEAATWQQDFSGLYASLDHNHDNKYSQLNHNHDDKYSQLNHNHDDKYSQLNHTHQDYLTAIPGKTIVAYGVVKADGTKLSGSGNWTVVRNSSGQYQLNITDIGNYVVITGLVETGSAEASDAIHDLITGIFNNNTAANIITRGYTGSITDNSWVFYAIQL